MRLIGKIGEWLSIILSKYATFPTPKFCHVHPSHGYQSTMWISVPIWLLPSGHHRSLSPK